MIIKNSNLRRSMVDNRYKILGIIIGAILIFAVIQLFNNIAKNSRTNSTNITVNQNTYQPADTMIYGGDISEKQQETNSNVIDTFIGYCNNKETQKAYNLLTDECKSLVYPQIEHFQNNFINKIFDTKKTYSMQSWMTNRGLNTYKVKIIEDILSTGKFVEEETSEDYYTIVNQNGEYKLNINSYIGRENINKEKETDNLKILVISKDVYMNYEIYNIQVQNKTNDTIFLDSKQDTKSVYLTGSGTNTFRAFIYELGDATLTLKARQTKYISIKFNKVYNPNVKVGKMVFSNIINNYDDYKQTTEKKEYKNITKMEIEL